MESVISALGEWNSFSESEEADFMSQLIDNFSVPNNYSSSEIPSTCWLSTTHDAVDETSFYLSDNTNSNPNCLLQDYTSFDVTNSNIFIAQPSRDNKFTASSRKRSSSTADVHENKEKVTRRKSEKLVFKTNEDEADHDSGFGQVMKICGSDGESDFTRESSKSPKPKEAKANGKTRANRGSASDPQSVYARKRRERINERLRILQRLVPNGTKVDISTMLEQAVQYVKFLQLQIKLLSSDDMWMYAPIAYNGMDIGLDLTIPSPR